MASRRDDVLLEAEFDPKLVPYGRWAVSGWMIITGAGIPLIPFWLLWSIRYAPMAMARLSARLTTTSLEVSRGVYFRSDATIPLDRITDVRVHDSPLMRWFGLQGLRVETAGQAGSSASSEGQLIGVVDSVAFRDAILRQREALREGGGSPVAVASMAATSSSDSELLTEIRDLLRSIDSKT